MPQNSPVFSANKKDGAEMRLDAWIVFGLWLFLTAGLIAVIGKQDQEKRELVARHAAELAELRKEHQKEMAKAAAKYCHALNIAEDKVAEAKKAAEKEIQRLRLDNKALREVLRTMEEKKRRAAS